LEFHSVDDDKIKKKINKFVRNDRTVRGRTGTDGVGVGIHIRNSLRCKIEFLFLEIRLLNRVVLLGSVYRPPISSIVNHALESGDYGLDSSEGVCSDLLFLYGEVFIL
jgi:hypothetical protein